MERLTNEQATALLRDYRMGTGRADTAAEALLLDVSRIAGYVARDEGLFNYHDISDVQQECCLRAAFIMAGKTALDNWVHFVNNLCRWKVRDYIRAECRWRTAGERQMFEQPQLPDMLARKAEAYEELHTCLSMLPERERLLMELRYMRDKALRDVGKAMGVSAQRADVLCKRTLSKLKDMLGVTGICNARPWL